MNRIKKISNNFFIVLFILFVIWLGVVYIDYKRYKQNYYPILTIINDSRFRGPLVPMVAHPNNTYIGLGYEIHFWGFYPLSSDIGPYNPSPPYTKKFKVLWQVVHEETRSRD